MICENCGNKHDGTFGSGRFCKKGCANQYSRHKDNNRKTKIADCIVCGVSTEVDKRTSTMFVKCKTCNPPKRKKLFYSTRDILNGKHPQYPTLKLKLRLFKEGLKEEKCECCGLVNIWQGKPISLQLNHIDGNNKNHSFDNLEILCPNCHTQTETYAGRNKLDRVINY